MPRHSLSALAGLVLLVATPFASAVPVAPTATLTADGQQFNIPVSLSSDGTYYKVGGDSGWQKSTSDFSVSLTGTIDTDPAVDYGITVTDFGLPSSFSFTFSDPITFPAGLGVVRSSITGGLNDVGGDGASVTPTGTKVQESSVGNGGPLTNMGVDIGNSLTISSGGPPGTLAAYGPFNSSSIAGPLPGGPWSTLEATAAFGLSGGGDIFTATGHAEIVVPEPASVSVLAIATLPMLRRRRAK
jgi:hypothetical protein